MHLIYLDESGNTGTNLKDSEQPIFVLVALIVPEGCWQQLEIDLEAALTRSMPTTAVEEVEVHCGDLRSGRGKFKGVELKARIALRNDWLMIAKNHGLKVVYRAIVKRKFERWMHHTFGTGVAINPYVAAFPLVARVVDEYLCGLPDKALGMFIADENKEIVHDIEKSIKVLRGAAGSLRLAQIVEKGFFIDSEKSRVLQLCDLCALSVRKKEEAKEGIALKGFDKQGVDLIDSLIHRGNELMLDVLAWLADQQNNSGESGEKK